MALFPRVGQSDFGSLFRLLEDWETHRQDRVGSPTGAISSYSPRFDVREDREAYHLDGELPGIDQKDINIEFTDPHTLVINGRTERSYAEGAPPGKRLEGGMAAGGEKAHRIGMEEEGGAKKGGGGVKQQQPQDQQQEAGGHRYWVSERSVGEFQRSFSFPTRVNQDGVKANLKHGVLSVTVPKATAPTSKRITVE